MATNTYGSSGNALTPRQTVHAMKNMLKHAEPHLVIDLVASHEEMPKNSSDTAKFRRYLPFSAVDTPLQEGVTPNATAMTYEDYSATLAQYGEPVKITDVISDLHEDPILTKASELCGENAGRTIESLDFGKIKAGTSVFYGNGASRAAVKTAYSLNLQRRMVRYLEQQKAKPITKVIKPGMEYDTSAVPPCYIGLCHTDVCADLENLPGWVPTEKYGTYKPLHPREVGKCGFVRYITSADLTPWQAAGSATLNGMVADDATNVDVYPVMIFGQDAYTKVALKGMNAIKPNVVPVNQATKDDPMAQRGFVSWKTYWAGVITNQTWMARGEVGVSDLLA